VTTQQASTIASRLRLQRRIGARFVRVLKREFRRQGELVHDRYLASAGVSVRSSHSPIAVSVADPTTTAPPRPPQTTKVGESLITEADLRALMVLFNINEQQMYEASAALIDDVLGTPNVSLETGQVVPRQLPLPLRERIAARVTRVNAVTKRAISKTIKDGMADGLDQFEIAKNLRKTVRETYKNRAETIARTELALVDQEAAHDRYEAAGVTHVRIFDGSDCGWTRHQDPDKANGSIRTLEESRRRPVSHPNCQRSSGAIVL